MGEASLDPTAGTLYFKDDAAMKIKSITLTPNGMGHIEVVEEPDGRSLGGD